MKSQVISAESEKILEQIAKKRRDLETKGYSKEEDCALTSFFDLAQETFTVEELAEVARGVLKICLQLEVYIYVVNIESGKLDLVFSDGSNLRRRPSRNKNIRLQKEMYMVGNSLFLPFRGNEHLKHPNGFTHNLFGILEVMDGESLTAQQILFLQKFSNHVGCAMHRRILAKQDSDHLRFISTLIADIEHNVIVPNMIFRLFLQRIQVKIKKNIEIENFLRTVSAQLQSLPEKQKSMIENCLAEMGDVNRTLEEEYANLEKHYKNTSLFLETLFRKSHFEAGRFILKKRSCQFKKEVIDPQLERFLPRFETKGIAIDNSLGGVPDIEIELVVDVGMISQAYANLFSNALKYTREVIDENGKKVKYIAYGWEKLPDYFGHKRDGIKFNVFSTGMHVHPEEVEKIFEEGYRGKNSVGEPGTGHGLSFVKNVIKIHGGVSGYEATPSGNNFFFILPVGD